MATKTLAEVIKEAREHAHALSAERNSRASGLHADDHRIPTEIAEHLFQLGRMEKGLRDQNQRWRDGLVRNDQSIEEVREIYGLLQREMEIATHHVSGT